MFANLCIYGLSLFGASSATDTNLLEHDGERALLAMTCLKLHQARIVRPAIGTLERLVGGISELSTQETYRRLAPLLTDEVCQQLDALLLPEAGRHLTRHRWLVQPATASNPAAIATALDKLRYLDGLGVASWEVSGLHPNWQKRLALLARSRSNRHLERLPTAKRYPVLVAFLRESYLTLTNEVLGMFYCPRMRDLADQRLYKIRGQDWTYPDLKFTGTLNPDYIRRPWDELLQLAGSIKSGRVTASLFIGKLQAYPWQNHLTYVLQAYGQLIKTRFIMRYLQSQPLRQRIQAQLNKGEELHALRAWLWFGNEGVIRLKQQEAQTEAARCLTLLTNCVLLWNTVYMQEVLQQLRAEGYPVEDAHFEYLSPSRYKHINRLGKYSCANPAHLDPLHRRPLRHPSDPMA